VFPNGILGLSGKSVEGDSVSDFVEVDDRHLRKLGAELRSTAGVLGLQMERFHKQTRGTRGAYGETPEARTAEHEYQETVRQTMDELERLRGACLVTAAALVAQADGYAAAEDAAVQTADSLWEQPR
jgi:hypothetical protein